MSADIRYSHSDLELFTAERAVPKSKHRRADPAKRKREKEERDFPGGLDSLPPRNQMFSSMTTDQMKRLTAMLKNFLVLEDGTINDNVDLQQFGYDWGEVVTNAVLQELCSVQPNMRILNLANCLDISDVGLWSIARHCTRIKELKLSGCNQITNIGLRSVSLRCCDVITLNFNNCILLDDIALTVIATGAWKIENLYLRGCVGITDTGVGKIAKASDRLKVLDLNGCKNVGEYGDHALKEIGAFCSQLQSFDFSGCKHVEDAGLKSVAVGCTNLRLLAISGCENISIASIRALCKHQKYLSDLKMVGLKRLCDKDLEEFNNCAFQHSLTALDLSGGSKLTDRGVSAVCRAVGISLFHLGIQGSSCTDVTSNIVTNMCPRLQSLDLSRCPAVTDQSIHTLAKGISALSTLKLDGNERVTMKAIYSHVGKTLEFADLAMNWLGYQPKAGFAELIAYREKHRYETAKAITIQSIIRRKFAFKKWKEKKRWWLISYCIPRVQALVRMRMLRKKYKQILYERWRIKQVIIIQKNWRKLREVIAKKHKIKAIRFASLKEVSALTIQKAYHRMVAVKYVKSVRNRIATNKLLVARIQSVQEVRSGTIQRVYRGYVGRCEIVRRKILLQERRERDALIERMMRLLQRVARGKLGRMRSLRRRREIEYQVKCWFSCIIIQKAFRGMKGRQRWAHFKMLWWIRIKNEAATNIQRIYRGYRGQILFAVATSLRQLRIRQQAAALLIQRWARGISGRDYAKRYGIIKNRNKIMNAATLVIQTLYRGHKGREAAEIEGGVASLEGKVQPLADLLKRLEADAMKLGKLIIRMEKKDKLMTDEIFEIERELIACTTTSSKFSDSNKINGIPQRFLTKYLRVRLKDHYEREKEVYKSKYTELQRKRKELRDMQVEITAARRELLPLTVGLVSDIKKQRSIRLRKLVRMRKKSATTIQAAWRGGLVRMANSDAYKHYWIKCTDTAQDDKPYYYNTETQQTNWQMPLSFKYFMAFRYRVDKPKKGYDEYN